MAGICRNNGSSRLGDLFVSPCRRIPDPSGPRSCKRWGVAWPRLPGAAAANNADSVQLNNWIANHRVGEGRSVGSQVEIMIGKREVWAKKNADEHVQNLTGDVPAVLQLIVENLEGIAETFGAEVADMVLVELAARVRRIAGLPAESIIISAAGVSFSVVPEKPAELLWASASPVCVRDATVVLALALFYPDDLGWRGSRALGDVGILDDMMLASQVHEAVSSGRSTLVLQPIIQLSSSGANDQILYWECLSRLTDGYGRALSPARFVAALERQGLARLFDAHVIRSTIALLKRTKDISLGCNISAQSAKPDEWWRHVEDVLAKDRDVACRLVIEITESAPVTNPDTYARFVTRMRSLGCRIALDDFGKGFHSIGLTRECRPDIIKLDAGLIPRGDRSEVDIDLFTRLISLANALADTVVVEGVEDQTDQSTAVKCGAYWMQGYHFAQPSSRFDDAERTF